MFPYPVGVDAQEPGIERSRPEGIHDEYRPGDILNLDETFD